MIENRLEGEERLEARGDAPPDESQDDPQVSESAEPDLETPAESEPLVVLEGAELRRAVEAILFAISEPISVRSLSEVVGVPVHDVREAIEVLRLEYVDSGRAFRLEDIAGGVQILTLRHYEPWIRKLRENQREGRLSGAALETLSVIAYKQPIQRADLEAIRGVNCGPILRTLLDRGLVKVVGRGEGLGRPLLYGTTRRFLESFGIASIRDLPQPDSEAALVAPAEPDAGEGRELYEEREAELEPAGEPGGRSLLEEERIESQEIAAEEIATGGDEDRPD